MPQSDTFPSVAVVYLARGLGAGVDAARQFFVSYDQHPSGISHELIVLVKGWENVDGLDEVLSMARSHNARVIELPDDGFDLGAYFRAAKKIPHEWCCFFNSHSKIQGDNWLQILYKSASQHGVGAVSCSGNWGTTVNFFLKPFVRACLYAKLWTALRHLKYALTVALPTWRHIPIFPNPHIRTNAFIVRRTVWLEFEDGNNIPTSKRDCYVLEHGRKGFTRFLGQKGLKALVAGADGRTFLPSAWLESGTCAVPGLPNLLVSDNQAVDYLEGDRQSRRTMEFCLWGKELTPQNDDGRRSITQQWRNVPKRVASELQPRLLQAGFKSLKMLCPPASRYFDKVKNLRNQNASLQAQLSNLPGRMYILDPSPLRFTSWPRSLTDINGEILYLPPRELISPFFSPIQVVISNTKNYQNGRVNIMLPSTSAKHNSGGPNTAYTLAAELVKNGVPLRIIAVTMTADSDSSEIRKHIAKIGNISFQQTSCIEFLDASDRNIPVQLGERDVFIATAWWTAQMVKYILPLFREKKFVYLIQDFEPLIHNASTNYALALETYSLDMLPIFNSGLLRDYFVQEKVGRFSDPTFAAKSFCVEPAVDRTLYYPSTLRRHKRKKRLLFYTRPMAERNLLEIGIGAMMKVLAENRCDPNEWEFLSTDTGISGQCRPVVLCEEPEVLLTPLDVRNISTWAEEMRSIDILLSLILSPHTSYPPLEAAACGALVVTNTWSVKSADRLQQISPNILAGPANIEGIAEVLCNAMALCKEDKKIESSTAYSSSPATWEESWRPVLPDLLSFFKENGIHNDYIKEK